MESILYLETTNGTISSKIVTNLLNSELPFGYVGYRDNCTSNLSEEDISEFWNTVDVVLINNNLTSTEFIRAVRVVNGNNIIGEL
jgi:hypothetical protein